MRYYDIQITNPSGGAPVKRFTSFQNGKSIPGALNVELDIPVVPFATPMGAALVRIWGISLDDIGQASDLNNMNVAVYAGMQKGLPLANPAQAGLIVQGVIFQALGNWIGTSMTLDLFVMPSTGSQAQPKNIVINWKKGTPFADAIKNTLSTAFPGYTADVKISDKLVLAHDEPGYYQTVTQFAQYVKQVSLDIVGADNYAGVDIMLSQKAFAVTDGTTPSNPTKIAFQDLIGQPTWIDPLSIQFKCAMRADLSVGGAATMPQSIATQSVQANSPLVNAKSIFQGTFQIKMIRHVGNFRQPDASSWVTTVDAFSTKAAA